MPQSVDAAASTNFNGIPLYTDATQLNISGVQFTVNHGNFFITNDANCGVNVQPYTTLQNEYISGGTHETLKIKFDTPQKSYRFNFALGN